MYRLTTRQFDEDQKRDRDEKDMLVKAAWDDFRISKAYGSSLEYLHELSIYDRISIEMIADFVPEQDPEGSFKMPLSGSRCWTDCIDAPGWFLSYLDLNAFNSDDPIVDVLKKAGKRLKLKGKGLKYTKGRM